MLIDWNNLTELHVAKVPRQNTDERFYAVPKARRYALSNYGRLYKKTETGGWNKVPIDFSKGNEVYTIIFDDGTEKSVTIRKLIAMVFYPNEEGIYLYNPNWNPSDDNRWKVDRLDVLRGKDDIVESILAKLEQRVPMYEDYNCDHGFLNQPVFSKPINAMVNDVYWNMVERATNEGVKRLHPRYTDTTICDEWLNNPESFHKWYMDNLYYYPGRLSLDKDILSFGIVSRYCPEYVCIVPQYINNVFTRNNPTSLGYCIQEKERADGTKQYIIPASAYRFQEEKLKQISCESYVEALQAGRNRKASFIMKIVEYEREQGFMPEHILSAMEVWANRCKLGFAKLWEPEEIFSARGLT